MLFTGYLKHAYTAINTTLKTIVSEPVPITQIPAAAKNSLESEAHIAQEEISSLSSHLAIAESTINDLRTESQTITNVNIEQLATVKEDLARVLHEKNAAEVFFNHVFIYVV